MTPVGIHISAQPKAHTNMTNLVTPLLYNFLIILTLKPLLTHTKSLLNTNLKNTSFGHYDHIPPIFRFKHVFNLLKMEIDLCEMAIDVNGVITLDDRLLYF